MGEEGRSVGEEGFMSGIVREHWECEILWGKFELYDIILIERKGEIMHFGEKEL